MKLGVSTYACSWSIGLPGSMPPEPLDAFSFLRRVADLGVHLAQIADNLPLDALDSAERSRLRRLADSLGVQLEVGTRGLTVSNVTEYLEIARELGSPVLRMVIDRGEFRPGLGEIGEILAAVLPRFEKQGVTLAIENHDRFRSSEFADIVRSSRSPNIGICLDTANSFGALEGPEVVIETLGPLAVNLHVKDFTIERVSHQMGFVVEGSEAGKGRLSIPALLARLRDFGRNPNAIIELWVTAEASIEATLEKEARWLRGSVDYLRGFLAE